MDCRLENLVGSILPAWRDLIETDTNRFIHERNYPVNSLLAKADVLPEAHDHQPLISLYDPEADQEEYHRCVDEKSYHVHMRYLGRRACRITDTRLCGESG
jgi:hypothetical protein